jgi:hypothetical protein
MTQWGDKISTTNWDNTLSYTAEKFDILKAGQDAVKVLDDRVMLDLVNPLPANMDYDGPLRMLTLDTWNGGRTTYWGEVLY